MEARNRESARAATDFSATRRCAIGADMTGAATTKSRACVHGPISTSTRFHRAWHVSRAAVPWGCSRSKYGGEVDFDELAVESIRGAGAHRLRRGEGGRRALAGLPRNCIPARKARETTCWNTVSVE